MRKVATITILFLLVMPALGQQRGNKAGSNRKPQLTLALARKILLREIDKLTVDTALFTCRACFDFEDKGENLNFPLVSSYTTSDGRSLSQFLTRTGYVKVARENGEDKEFFTAKAKASKNFEADAAPDGSFGGAGLRFAYLKNPKILVTSIVNTKSVPMEYDFVPEPFVSEFFGAARRVQANVSFEYYAGHWSICINCK